LPEAISLSGNSRPLPAASDSQRHLRPSLKPPVETYAKPNKRSGQEDEPQLGTSLLPKWKTRPAAEISAEDLLAVLNAKVKDGAPVAANRLRALVSRIFTFGAEQRLVSPTANPDNVLRGRSV
jgi:hypothetical protein